MTNNKKQKIRKIILITLAVILALLSVCSAVISVSATDWQWCPECGSTDGNHGGYSNVGTTHYESWYCKKCDRLYSREAEHTPNDFLDAYSLGNIYHEASYYCACGAIVTVSEAHTGSIYLRQEYDDNYHYAVYLCDLCGGEWRQATSHTIPDGVTDRYVDNGKYTHSAFTSCYYCDYEKKTDTNHNYNVTNVCVCGRTKSTDYKHDINYKTSNSSNNQFATLTNDSYDIQDNIKVGTNGILNVYGWIAINDGVNYYYYQVITGTTTSGTTKLVNKDSAKSLSQGTIDNINNSDLVITDFNSNAYYNLDIDLTDYEGQDITLMLACKSNSGQSVAMAVFTNVSYGEKQTDIETETETETDSNGNTPIPPNGDGNYNSGYADGYEQALRDTNSGIFSGADFFVTFIYDYDETPGFSHSRMVHLPININNGGLDLTPAWEWWKNSEFYNNSKYNLFQIVVELNLATGFEWSNDLIYFTLSSGAKGEKYLPFSCYVATVENATLHDVYYTLKGNKYYFTVDNLTDSVDMLTFYINNQNISIEKLFDTEKLAIHNNVVNYTLHTSSYNKGKNDGYDLGSDEGYAKGFDEGKKHIDAEKYNEGYKNGYEKGEDEGYSVGFIKGKAIGLKENFNWYEIPTSILDSMSNTFHNLFAFEIFGVNIASFLLSVMTMLIAGFILKKVL